MIHYDTNHLECGTGSPGLSQTKSTEP